MYVCVPKRTKSFFKISKKNNVIFAKKIMYKEL